MQRQAVVTSKENALWLLEKLVPGTGVNNIGVTLQVNGRLEPAALATSISAVIDKYEILRTVFVATDTELLKRIVPGGELKIEIEQVDLAGEQYEDDLTAFVARPFELDGSVMCRVGLASHPDGDILCMVFHHLIFDVVSAAAFVPSLVAAYEAVVAGQPIPQELSSPVSDGLEPEPQPDTVAYWRENLRGFLPQALDLWCGSPRPRNPLLPGDIVRHALSAEGRSAVQRLQREVRAPAAAVLLAAYYVLLANHGAGPDLVIGSPLDVRGAGSGAAIGYHVNVVPLRLRVDFAESFRQLTRRARDTFLASMRHSAVSVDDLTAELPRAGSSWQTTLYRHMFNFLPEISAADFAINGMNARLLSIENGYSKFDLELTVVPSKSEIWFRYCSEILDRDDVESLLRRYERLLICAAQDADQAVGELATWSEQDRTTIDLANQTARQVEPGSVLAAFETHAVGTPEAIAVLDAERSLTYRDVWASACAVRDRLRKIGVGAADVVAVVVPRTAEVVIGVLGVWLAGAAFLLIDAERGGQGHAPLIAQSGAKAVLAGTGVQVDADADLPDVIAMGTAVMGTAVMSTAVMSTVAMDAAAEEPLDVDVLSPACVLCSPGQTAARVLSHQGIANMASHFAAELAAGLGTGAIALADFSSFGFLLEFFVPMSSGGRVVIAPDDVRAGGTALGDFMAHHGVEIVQVPPGVPARILDDAVDRVPRLRIVARAEDLQPALARRFLAAGCELRSVFGDVETGGWAISGLVDDTLELTAGRLATGRPIANTRAFIVAPDGRELPVGVRGELCLAGSGVAAEPYYQTRELARWRPDGTIERLGQMGSQVVAAEQPDDAAEHQLQDAKDPVLEKLVALWRDLLTTDVSAQTNFFTAGGHSLMAAKLAQDIEQFTGVHLELTDVFDHPTPAGIAVRLKELEQTICTGVPQ